MLVPSDVPLPHTRPEGKARVLLVVRKRPPVASLGEACSPGTEPVTIAGQRNDEQQRVEHAVADLTGISRELAGCDSRYVGEGLVTRKIADSGGQGIALARHAGRHDPRYAGADIVTAYNPSIFVHSAEEKFGVPTGKLR